MNARKWINHCFVGCFGASLMSLSVTESKAESGFLPVSQIKTWYSRDIASFNYALKSFEPALEMPQKKNPIDLLGNTNSRFQKKAGKAVYKVLKSSRSKLATHLTGAALIHGLDSIDMAVPVKSGFLYVKEKTSFNFGRCSQVRLSTKRLKAQRCLFNDKAKLEFHANYKMDSFRLKFHWPM